MKIDWKSIGQEQIKIINGWLTGQDKHNLCLTEKSWEQTAFDINDCLKNMDNAQFKNIIGYINGSPAVAIMFGVEHLDILNLYNIIVNPKCRHMGIAKEVLLQLLNNEKSLNIIRQYKKVKASVLPENEVAIKLFNCLNFDCLGFNGEYVLFEKNIIKTNQKEK